MVYVGFDALSKQLKAKGAGDSDALAAWIGRKKYGKAKFTALAKAARSAAGTATDRSERPPLTVFERSAVFSVVEPGSDARTLSGYAAVFDTPTLIRDDWGEFEEVITRGAFTRSITERDPVLMFEHGRHPLIGSMPLGRIHTLREDAKGLYVEARLSDNWLISPVRDAIRDGAVSGMSFRFTLPPGGDSWEQRDGRPQLRTVRDANVIELGPVVFPAYKPTTASIRSLVEQLPAVDTPPPRPPGAVETRLPAGHGGREREGAGMEKPRADGGAVDTEKLLDLLRGAVRTELRDAGITAVQPAARVEPPPDIDPARLVTEIGAYIRSHPEDDAVRSYLAACGVAPTAVDPEPRGATPGVSGGWASAVAHLATSPADGWSSAVAHLRGAAQ